MVQTASISRLGGPIEALLVGPLVASMVEDLDQWRTEDCNRQGHEEPESPSHLMAGIRLTLNVGYAARVHASQPAETLERTQQAMLEELRSLRDCFAPEEEIRATASRLRSRQRELKPLVEEHDIIAIEAGRLFDELSDRYLALVYPVRGQTSQLRPT
jgi:hypothetical protein